MSSGVNSIAAIVLSDFILLIRPNMTLKRRLVVSKIICKVLSYNVKICNNYSSTFIKAIFVGSAVLVTAYGASFASSTLLQLHVAINGSLCGPILGITLLGMFVPFVNSKVSLLFICWLIDNLFYNRVLQLHSV